MSEERNDAGQFTAEPEPKYGLEGVEAEAGFTRMPDPAADEENWSFDGKDEEAAEIFAAISEPAPETVEIFYKNPDGSKMDENLSVDLNRAADDLAVYHGDRDADMEAALGKEWAAEVDKLRADRIKTAADAEHFGVPLPKAEKAAAVEGDEAHEPDAYDEMPGLDEPTKALLRNPLTREALEQNEQRTAAVTEAYNSALANANSFAQAAFLENFLN